MQGFQAPARSHSPTYDILGTAIDQALCSNFGHIARAPMTSDISYQERGVINTVIHRTWGTRVEGRLGEDHVDTRIPYG